MEEYYDILDENGNKIGLTKARSLIHKDGDWHRASHVWIINSDNELLISLRSLTKDTCPGYWTMSAGGHVNAGEEPLDAAVRELEEEIGVQLTKDRFKEIFITKQVDSKSSKGKIISQFHNVYLVEEDINIEKLEYNKEEVSKIKFIHYKELEKLIANRKIKITPQYEQFKKLFQYIIEHRG